LVRLISFPRQEYASKEPDGRREIVFRWVNIQGLHSQLAKHRVNFLTIPSAISSWNMNELLGIRVDPLFLLYSPEGTGERANHGEKTTWLKFILDLQGGGKMD
jgi:hypothetical protein